MRPPIFVTHQCPTAEYNYLATILCYLRKLTAPFALFPHGNFSFFKPWRDLLVKELLRVTSDHFVSGPTVETFSTFVPIEDSIIEIASDNRILRLVEEFCLLLDLFFRKLALRYVVANRHVLVRLPVGVEEGNNGRINPV